MTTTVLPLTTGTWTADIAHSSVEFTVRHLGLAKVRGRFNSFSTNVVVADDLAASSVHADIDLSSIDTNNADRDAHLRSTDFFGVEANPTMSFRSTAIVGSGDDYTVTGDLSINGVTRPVELSVEFLGSETYPMDGTLRAGFSATGSISRKEFGIQFDIPLGADKMAIGDKVNIELEIQLVAPQ
ncbi:MAG: polyisoprenoid-binding protein [Acidimicrobiales bacterium]|nr:polyisoprenoid-binding protein [Acidimicrobiales bacterium]